MRDRRRKRGRQEGEKGEGRGPTCRHIQGAPVALPPRQSRLLAD